MKNRSGIYLITNTINGKRYVGQAVDLHVRIAHHKSALRRGKHHSAHLQASWDKHGSSAFTFEVIEFLDRCRETLHEREVFWVNTLKPEYNTGTPGIAPMLGKTHTDVARAKIAAASAALVYTPEFRANKSRAAKESKKAQAQMAKLHAAKRGVPRSDETKAKLRTARLGFRHSEETLARLRQIAANSTYKHPPEVRARISEALKGKKLSAEHIEKTRRANLGRKHSPEHIAKRVAKLVGHAVSPEARAAIGAANKARLTGTKQSAELIEKRIAPLRGRKRSPELMAALHETLRKSREIRAAPIKALIAENMHLSITELCKLVGLSFKPVSRYKKELLCQTPQPNASAVAAQSSPKSAEPSSASPSASPPLQSSLFG